MALLRIVEAARRAAASFGTAQVATAGGLLGALCVAAAFTAHEAHATAYLSDDPAACVNCHIMREQYDSWGQSPHHARASCNDCHVPHDSLWAKYAVKAEHGYRHSKGFTFQDFHEPIQITPSSRAVVIDNCVRCHAALTHDLRLAAQPRAASAMALEGPPDCIRCHSSVAHGSTR